MTAYIINTDELLNYVECAFDGDDDLLFYYDKKAAVKTLQDASKNVVEKIVKYYPECEIRGICINEVKVGYFVYASDLLVSFSINKEYRMKECLSELWELIKDELGDTFQCLLYSYNIRAINWLQRCGMDILFENATMLRFENNLN